MRRFLHFSTTTSPLSHQRLCARPSLRPRRERRVRHAQHQEESDKRTRRPGRDRDEGEGIQQPCARTVPHQQAEQWVLPDLELPDDNDKQGLKKREVRDVNDNASHQCDRGKTTLLWGYLPDLRFDEKIIKYPMNGPFLHSFGFFVLLIRSPTRRMDGRKLR